jgi:hypothetical protein
MFSLEIECDPDDQEFLVAELWENGSVGIAELSPRRVRAFFEEEAGRERMLGLYPGSVLRTEEQRDWVESARELLQPMEVGAHFFLVPEWRDDPAPPGRFRIPVNPGMAFGTASMKLRSSASKHWRNFSSPNRPCWTSAPAPAFSRTLRDYWARAGQSPATPIQ